MCRIMAMIISELQFHKKSLDHIILHTIQLPYYAVVSKKRSGRNIKVISRSSNFITTWANCTFWISQISQNQRVIQVSQSQRRPVKYLVISVSGICSSQELVTKPKRNTHMHTAIRPIFIK